MEAYPIKEKIRELLATKEQRLPWLVASINKSESWFFKLESIEDINLGVLLAMSDLLEFDLVLDYYKYTKRSGGNVQSVLEEPKFKYNKKAAEISITIAGSEPALIDKLKDIITSMK